MFYSSLRLYLTLRSVSEDQSILVMPPWCNPTLILADLVSLALHFVILEVPFMSVCHVPESGSTVLYHCIPLPVSVSVPPLTLSPTRGLYDC